jgi:hypothetical protein
MNKVISCGLGICYGMTNIFFVIPFMNYLHKKCSSNITKILVSISFVLSLDIFNIKYMLKGIYFTSSYCISLTAFALMVNIYNLPYYLSFHDNIIYLIFNSEKIKQIHKYKFFNQVNEDDCLNSALTNRDKETVCYLLDKGVNPNNSIIFCNKSMLNLLLKSPKINLNKALEQACSFYIVNYGIVTLLKKGAVLKKEYIEKIYNKKIKRMVIRVYYLLTFLSKKQKNIPKHIIREINLYL